jgi:DNA-binding YbaB/EbfC family protein
LRESATPPPTAATGDGGLDSLWSQLIEAVGRASPFTKSYLVEAFPVSATDKLLTIGFDPEFADHVGLVDNAKNHTLIATKLAELGRPGMQVKFVIQDAPAGEAGHEDTAPAPIPTPEGGPFAPDQGEDGHGESLRPEGLQKRPAHPGRAENLPSPDCGRAKLISNRPPATFHHPSIPPMSSIGKLMKQAARMQQQAEAAQAQLATRTVEATAGGGAVKVVARCDGTVASIRVDPSAINPTDAQLLEDLLLTAVNKALEEARHIANTEMSKITSGMMPGLLPGR